MLVGDDAADFVEQCCALYRDADTWRRQRDSALAAVVRECAPETFRLALQAALDAAQDSRRAREATSGVAPQTDVGSRWPLMKGSQ